MPAIGSKAMKFGSAAWPPPRSALPRPACAFGFGGAVCRAGAFGLAMTLLPSPVPVGFGDHQGNPCGRIYVGRSLEFLELRQHSARLPLGTAERCPGGLQYFVG